MARPNLFEPESDGRRRRADGLQLYRSRDAALGYSEGEEPPGL